MKTWLDKWEPENEEFWEKTGSKIAWRTLIITTLTLIISFASWFLMSVVVVKLPGLGFTYTKSQLFWLAAVPGLAAGVLRIIHTFILPIFGTRHVVTYATLIKLIPVVGIGFALMNPDTPFWLFMILAFMTGFGGGDFSSYMPSTSLFFPKRLKGTALGIQAGIGNFGVSLAQFVTPVILSIALYGAPSTFTKIDVKEAKEIFATTSLDQQAQLFSTLDLKKQEAILSNVDAKVLDSVKAAINSRDHSQIFVSLPLATKSKIIDNANPKLAEIFLETLRPGNKAVTNQEIYIQSAAFWYVPFLIIMAILSWFYLKSIPMKASITEQLDIFKSKHTWYCTITYLMTFGTFAGLSAAFPLMSRVLFGFIADKVGGAILTTITGLGILGGTVILVTQGLVAPTSMEQFPLFVGIILMIFFFTGVGNAGTFRQYPIIFGDNPRQAAGVIGWTAAVAAFGPFIFSKLIGANISSNGGANQFFIGLIIFSLIATFINWWFYNRKGCEKPS